MPRWARGALLFAVVAAGYAAGYELASNWFSAEDQGASFFPAAGVTLAALVLTERRRWPIVLAAAASTELVLDISNGTSAIASAGYALANSTEPLVGAALLTALVASVDLRRTSHLVAFIVSAVIVAPVVGGVIAATTFVFVDGNSGWARFAFEWWSGDGLGVLVVGGALLSLRSRPSLSRARLAEGAVVATLAIAATLAVFELGWFEFVYVPAALLVVLAFRVGTTGVALTSALVAFVAAAATAEAQEFWESLDVSPANRVLYLQLALGVFIAALLALAAEIAERERIAVDLARTEAERVAALERAALLENREELYRAEREARLRAELLESHAARLAAAVTSHDVARTTLTRLEEVGVSAAWVQLVRGDTLELLETSSVPNENLERYRRYPLRSSTPPAEAARTTAVVTVATGAELDAQFPDAAFGRRRLRYESLVSVPLVVADGQAHGVLTVVSLEAHWFDGPRRRLVVGLSEQCSLALVRAELQAEADGAAADAALLALLGDVLERATGMVDRAWALVRTLTLERAALAVVHSLDEDDQPRIVAHAGIDPDATDVQGPLIAGVAGQALSTDKAAAASAGPLQLLAIPLRARNRALGVLTIGFHEDVSPPVTPVLVQRVATRAALALDNALLYEQERDVSHSLQMGLLGGELGAMRNAAIATAYRPGTAALEVGGDWYDAFTLPDGRLALLVGDVVGHGLEAAVAMGQLRGAVRALAPLGRPSEVLERLDRVVDTLPEAGMATLAYVELDTVGGELAYACAGHPPPLLVPAEGAPRLLWDGRSTPLGSSLAAERAQAGDRLGPGDTIVLYTDGLVERRTHGIGERLELLVEVAARWEGDDPSSLVDQVLDALLDETTQEDDVCVLALRRVVTGVDAAFSHRFPADPVEVARMRRALARWLEEKGVEPGRREDAVLAVSEAAANAAEHAYGFDGTGVVRVDAWLSDGELQIEVRDGGTWREPHEGSGRGHGRPMMEALMRVVTVENRHDGTIVRMSVPTTADPTS